MAFERVRIDLRRLILLCVILASLITLVSCFYSAYRVQRQALIDNTEQANLAYAAKLASNIDTFLSVTQQKLAYSAAQLGEHLNDTAFIQAEAQRLKEQDQDFNSVFISDAEGRVLAKMPAGLPVALGQHLQTPGVDEALRLRRPLISKAYLSSVGNLVVFFSHPIVDQQGAYRGFVGGSIYLKAENVLTVLLRNHYHQEGTYAYVVDGNTRFLFHPDLARIGDLASDNNPIIQAVLRGERGSQARHNIYGVDVLAGYAPVSVANWGVITQTSRDQALKALSDLMKKMILGILPVGVLGALALWWLTVKVARPLRQLAENAARMDSPDSIERIDQIHAWYFEAANIKQAMHRGVELVRDKFDDLDSQARTDPLTGLYNRRAMGEHLERLASAGVAFSVITLDIDHFKRVNDSYGHDVGDVVLRKLGEVIRRCARHDDLSCRAGGEEFSLLQPGATLSEAVEVGERLRQAAEQADMGPVGHISISLGVAHWSGDDGMSIEQALKTADERLYQAKQQGRNRLVAGP